MAARLSARAWRMAACSGSRAAATWADRPPWVSADRLPDANVPSRFRPDDKISPNGGRRRSESPVMGTPIPASDDPKRRKCEKTLGNTMVVIHQGPIICYYVNLNIFSILRRSCPEEWVDHDRRK